MSKTQLIIRTHLPPFKNLGHALEQLTLTFADLVEAIIQTEEQGLTAVRKRTLRQAAHNTAAHAGRLVQFLDGPEADNVK